MRPKELTDLIRCVCNVDAFTTALLNGEMTPLQYSIYHHSSLESFRQNISRLSLAELSNDHLRELGLATQRLHGISDKLEQYFAGKQMYPGKEEGPND